MKYFDRAFFRFLIGFVAILIVSLSVFALTSYFGENDSDRVCCNSLEN